MLKYSNVQRAQFLTRENRFIAICRLLDSQQMVTVHVKNTGRCKELLRSGVEVALNYQPSPKRKTDYDLVAVKKGQQWVNIDSQIPNDLAEQGIQDGSIVLPNLKGKISKIQREVRFQNSRFDLYIETEMGEKAFVEVKGMTLENNQIGAFPDAPTLRGLKHVHELQGTIEAGYQAYLLFIVQFEEVSMATIHEEMQPALQEAIVKYSQTGLNVLAYNCVVTSARIGIKGPVSFKINQKFEDPNREMEE